MLAIILGLGSARLLKRLITALNSAGRRNLVWPVAVYGSVLTLMLLSALLTLSNPAWKLAASLLVSLGAICLYFSDLLLSWNRFISPIKNAPLITIILYHLGQIALVSGIISQFSTT